MGRIRRRTASRLHPYQTLSQFVKHDAQLMHLINKFNLFEKDDFFNPSNLCDDDDDALAV